MDSVLKNGKPEGLPFFCLSVLRLVNHMRKSDFEWNI
jgi:hypothetical protein